MGTRGVVNVRSVGNTNENSTSNTINENTQNNVLNLNKKVYAKNQYEKVIDTTFSQLATTPTFTVTSSIEAQIAAFFAMYDQLFYDIPKNGPTDSHEYLIKTSTEYINYTPINDDIQALIDEINNLQQQNLELNQQLVDLQISGSQT